MRTRWSSASAVCFIGSQRFSITIENEVSTSSATTAWVRALGLGHLDVVDGDPDQRQLRATSLGVPACRSTALVSVRVTFHGSVSPNCQGRVAPVSSPAAPARRNVTLAASAGKLLRHITQRSSHRG